ncbi:MAG: YadA-like family protein, partial [Synergistaceae bacterium]|nr:YadA-like family protein [Candidatus Equadaptatus faecalis]
VDLSGIATDITIENPDGKKIIFANGKNVNVTQDTSVADTIKFVVGTVENPTFNESVTVAPASANATVIDGNGITVGTSSFNSSMLTIGTSSLTTDTLAVGGRNYITSAGINANAQKITGVADGSTAYDAVNYGQFSKAYTDAAYAGNTLTLTRADGTTTDLTIAGGSGGGAWTAMVGGKSISVNSDKPTLTFENGGGITLEADEMSNSIKISATGAGGAISAGGTKPEGATDAKANPDGTAVASGYSSEANGKGSVATGYLSAVSPESGAGIAIGRGATVGYEGGSIAEDQAKDTKAVSGIAIGLNSHVEGKNSIAIGVGHVVTGNASGAFGDPTYIDADNAYAIGNQNNISATATGSFIMGNNSTVTGEETFVIGSGVTTSAKNSVILGSGSTAYEDNVVSVGAKGKERKITNVAPGEISATSTDAVNGSQLYEAMQGSDPAIRQELNAVANEVKEVGAISAALAGLHYVEPSGEEGDKFVGAVAYGNYRGESAAAIGVAFKPNPNFMLSASTSVGNSQNAYNAGVSFKFGKGETAVTRAALQKQVKFVNEENRVLKAQIVNLSTENANILADNIAQNEKLKLQDEAIEALKKENAEIKTMLNKVLKQIKKK